MHENETEKFILYRYLSFFWKKKWLVLILPILLTVAGAAYSKSQERPYTGYATVYVGTLEEGWFLEPAVIKAKLKEKVNEPISYSISKNSDKYIKFQISGKSEDDIRGKMGIPVEAYFEDLKALADGIYETKVRKVEALKSIVENSERSIEKYEVLLAEESLDINEASRITQLLEIENKNRSESLQNLTNEEKEVIGFSHPQIISQYVSQDPGNLKSNLLVGFVLGVFLSLVIFTLWKYIEDARRYVRD